MSAALSISPFAAALLDGPPAAGTAIGHGFVLVGDRVLAVTPPGVLRMPNGIEADLELCPGESVLVGAGELRAAAGVVTSGPVWNPRPVPRFSLSVVPRPELRFAELAGRGPGLTPLGDDILVGAVAALALAGTDVRLAGAWAETVARETTALSGTLLRLSAEGWLPEAAHRLLEDGDPGPLLAFGATSGAGIALGLALAGGGDGRPCTFTVPLDGRERRFELRISPRPRRARARTVAYERAPGGR